ncbi:MAG: hypothetical protein IJK55_09180 [Bacteroidales bacterium]|nr:hypothetical protein [Bacteroidales bacterium]
MRRFFTLLLLVGLSLTAWAQGGSALEQLRQDPRKSYGNDYPYLFETVQPTPAPRGYKPFYISHYARHGSRYYWNETLYHQLDTLLTFAHDRHQLTAEGEAFYGRFMAAKQELITGISELTQLGWDQHQRIARTMYNRFPEVFRDGGYVLAISSLSGRCVLSMSAFCQELVQCNPRIEIREQSSRFTLDAVVPNDKENPVKHDFPKAKPRYEQHRELFRGKDDLQNKVLARVFTSTDGLPGGPDRIAGDLINLYTSLPNIGYEGMMGSIITDEEMVERWESSNLGAYSWVFGDQYRMIPILDDIIAKADAAIAGTSSHRADLRFGHDGNIGPLTVLMGLNGADRDPEDPNEVKDCYQNWETCKASNIQLVFYRSRRHPGEVLVKCLLNGFEASLPMQTDTFPYYKWEDVRAFYRNRCDSVR